LLWGTHPQCCGRPTYHGVYETHCCGEPIEYTMNDAEIVAVLRKRFPDSSNEVKP
jgi:hypothetical protein